MEEYFMYEPGIGLEQVWRLTVVPAFKPSSGQSVTH
jgi:hypothetical protein